MQRPLRLLFGGLLLLGLQGCLLDYFFAPKIVESELPADTELMELRDQYVRSCNRCHLMVAPRYFDRDHPIDRYTRRYLDSKIINQREADQVAAYVRALAARLP
ncbi:MAG: hypothetical protein ACO1RX_11345 [Candidatus Sericytochromatia bacterium]